MKSNRMRAIAVVALIAVVGLLITVAVVVVDRLNDDVVDDPTAVELMWRQDDQEQTILPYRVCDLFEEDACETFEDNTLHVNLELEDTAELHVGEASRYTWVLSRFYADDALNVSDRNNPGQSVSETIAGSTSVNGERTALGVVEVSTTVVGKNAADEETTYGITWSIVNDAAGE